MIALYGTQARYAPEVMARGVYRDSAAVFLLPDFPERGMARRTLACAIYHAIGSPLLRETIQHGQNLAAALEKSAGGVCLICIRGIAEGEWRTDRYTLSDGETYSYVKLRESGPVDSEEKRSICLAPSIFEARIDSTDGTSGLRFFQKQNGETQHLPGCDMQTLERLCMLGAEQVLKESSLFFGETFCNENT